MKGAMSRNLYLLAATLLLFSLISCGMSLVPNRLQPGLPANGSLWKTIGNVSQPRSKQADRHPCWAAAGFA